MRTSDDHHDEIWSAENWTGEPDNVAAYALVVCLAVAALIFMFLGVARL